MASPTDLLRSYLHEFENIYIHSKFNIENKLNQFQENLTNLNQQLIQENDLIRQATGNHENQEILDQLNETKEQMSDNYQAIQEIIDQLKLDLTHDFQLLNYHTRELYKTDLDIAGFTKHEFAGNYKAIIDGDLITIKKDGHAETPIATDLKRWKDNNQFNMVVIKKDKK
jgi:hypothetical protein